MRIPGVNYTAVTVITSLYAIPPMPNRQQRRAAERKVRKHPNGCTINMGKVISSAVP